MELSGLNVGEGVRRQLSDGDKLSHAYIIAGPPGAGKHALAVRMASALVCTGKGEKPCGACPGCRKTAGGIHPDITWLRPAQGKREITVDQVRALRADAYIRPNEGSHKVYLVDPAQAMNPSAQNAMLKLLEDGPSYAAFLLLTENAGALLPTVRSRCECLTLAGEGAGPVQAPEELEQAIQAGRELAGHILSGDAFALAQAAAALEGSKWERGAVLALLDSAAQALHAALPGRSAQLLPWIDHLTALRRAALLNVGTGHLLGWLAVGPEDPGRYP